MTLIDTLGLFEPTVSSTKVMPIKRSFLQAFFEMILRNPPTDSPGPLAAKPI
jgi:hypothetical protein